MKPDCPMGYSHTYLKANLSTTQYMALRKWLNGKTQSVCDGRSYNHKLGKYGPNECVNNPHGVVVYSWDFDRWYHNAR